MPASIAHYLFAERALFLLKKRGIVVPDSDIFFTGAQGPDIFFFHRVFPWQWGAGHTYIGKKLHCTSPALLFEELGNILNTQAPNYDAVLSYIMGFFCHYALDRKAHPFIYWSQSRLALDDPAYGTNDYQYHFRIESALDTMFLRRQTGRLIGSFNLMSVLPRAARSAYPAIGCMYRKLLLELFGIEIPPVLLAHAPSDMRHALFFMDDRTTLRRKLIYRPAEKLLRCGRPFTSLLKPNHTGDWDYANLSHSMWSNPYDSRLISTDSFFDLYDSALNEACGMIAGFLNALPSGKTMKEITQDRGFSSDLPGVYGKPGEI